MSRKHGGLLCFVCGVLAACLACGIEDLPVLDGTYDEGPPLAAGGKADGLDNGAAHGPLPRGASLDHSLAALFAPDDPVVTLELKLIDEVVAARKADASASLTEGQNPYRIRYAVYNLRNNKIIKALADAEDDGVDVQILIEADQLDASRTWNTADEQLVQRGFELVSDHRLLTAQTLVSADLIGVKRSGLMHLKVRIFETPARRRVLSGSMNPGDNATLNEETLHLLNDARIVGRYAAAFEAVRGDRKVDNTWDGSRAVNVMFTPARNAERASQRLFQWLSQEQEQILLMVFSLRDITAPGSSQSLVSILAAKAAAGIPVIVITDRKQSDGVDAAGNRVAYDDDTEDRLRAAGVSVYEAVNGSTPYTAMHHKVAVLGRSRIRVITDAANWTASGLGSSTRTARNVESVLFIDTAKLDKNRTGRRYTAQWLRVLKRYAAQSAGDAEPGYRQVLASLTARTGWPTQQVSFEARDAHTSWGESIRVLGDLTALGKWGQGHAGVALTTDASTYPGWSSPSPVSLPLGVSFQWKLTAARDGGAPRWEQGGNRVHRAAPAPLQPGDGLRITATWR